MGIILKCFGGSASTSSKKQPSTIIEDLCHRFSLSQLRKSTEHFDQSRLIGEGGFGVVYRAFISINGQLKDIALKRLKLGAATSSEWLSLCKNNVIYRGLVRHPNLVSLVGFCDDHNELIVAYDYPPKGSLYHQLYDGIGSNSPILSWKKRLEIAIGVARGLHYLHCGTKRTIIHGDITSSSILLYDNWVPKISYFGLSVKGPKFSAKDVKPIEVERPVGTMGYIDPECVWSISVTDKSDVYSFGAVLLELICRKSPHQITMSQHDEISAIKEVRDLADTGKVEGIIDGRLVGGIAGECWKLYMGLVESCLSEDPNERPHMGEVEVQLERILQLQEEADSNHASRAFFI